MSDHRPDWIRNHDPEEPLTDHELAAVGCAVLALACLFGALLAVAAVWAMGWNIS